LSRFYPMTLSLWIRQEWHISCQMQVYLVQLSKWWIFI